MTDYKNVIYKRMSQGTFGGNNYYFVENNVGDVDQYVVCVGWALLAPHKTIVLKNDEQIGFFGDERYVLPKEAFKRLGIEVVLEIDDCEFSGLPKLRCFHCEPGVNLEKFYEPAADGQLFYAEWVDGSNLLLTPSNRSIPESKLIPQVLAIRWNGDNINEFIPFRGYGLERMPHRGDLMVKLADSSITRVAVGEWVIRDSQGNLNPQSKKFEESKSITLHDGILYELRWRDFESGPAVSLSPILPSPIE